MFITTHAKERYLERCNSFVPDNELDQKILNHIALTQPATDAEMTVIRRANKLSPEIKDKSGAVHYVDRKSLMVFVIGSSNTIFTCYSAPYLAVLDKQYREMERKDILAIFKEARKIRSIMPWTVAMYLLYKHGFETYLNGIRRDLTAKECLIGLDVSYLVVKKIKWLKEPVIKLKSFKDCQIIQASWERRFQWKFSDFGISYAGAFSKKK